MASKTYYIHEDHLGGSSAITDSSGNSVEILDYYPYGSTRIDDKASSFNDKHKYTGKELDNETGLYYYGQRYYNPMLARFVSEDPVFLSLGAAKETARYISDPQGLNSYSYARNNPLVWVDRDGKTAVLALMGIGAVVGVTSQAISDYITGQDFVWQNYVGAASGGAVGSLAFVGSVAFGGGIVSLGIAGGVGSTVNETISQSLQVLSGDKEQHNWTEISFQGLKGIGSGYLPVPRIGGVTVGSNSFSAINRQVTTKVAGGSIQNFTTSTASKILTSQFVSSSAHTVQMSLGKVVLQQIATELQRISQSISAISKAISNLKSLQAK